MNDTIITQDEKWTEYQAFCVRNKVIFNNGERDFVDVKVISKDKYEARDIAKDFLLSRKAFLIQAVVGQNVESTTIIVDNRFDFDSKQKIIKQTNSQLLQGGKIEI